MMDAFFPLYTWLVYIPFALSWTLICTVIVIPLTVLMPVFAERWMPRIWTKPNYLASLSSLIVTGKKELDTNKSYIIVANHVSQFDIFLIYGWTPLDIKWVMKKEIRKVPFLGIACAMMGHIFIDRSNRAEAMRTLDAFKATMQPGTSVMFFPEGTRSNGKPPLKFKQGAFSMAKDMDLPILPVTILGTEKILPKKTLNLMRGKSEIIFHPAIEIEQVRAMNVEELAIKSAQIVAGPITEESITEGVTA
jgi:1-acyl-sn-glycerol-3-phosphate acyltransferase